MEAHYVEAGSMSIFWTQNRAKLLALHVGRSEFFSMVGPKLGSVGLGGS